MSKKENIYLDPLYKWTGGKRKEIKIFSVYYPEFIKNSNDYKFVEPFFGGGAVYWSLNAKENVINDIDEELVNFIRHAKSNPEEIRQAIKDLSDNIKSISDLEKSKSLTIAEAKTKRGVYYYEWRNKDRNNGLKSLSPLDRAIRFYIVNQLAFNGMRRFNSKGEFNIPYGNYKSININLSDKHVDLLQRTNIMNGSYRNVMLENDTENTFIYLDPPYTREFKEYSHENVFGAEQQIELADTFKSMKNAKVMIIINKDEFTSELYDGYIKHTYDLKYSTNIKNRYDNSVQHLLITNY
jgi:DNA adenine methylase